MQQSGITKHVDNECKKKKTWSRTIYPLNTDCNLKKTIRPSPYRAVNTLRLCYKNQSVNAV